MRDGRASAVAGKRGRRLRPVIAGLLLDQASALQCVIFAVCAAY